MLFISDVYPTLEVLPTITGVNIHLHAIYPISPTRTILLNKIFFKKQLRTESDPFYGPMIKLSRIKGQMLKEPKCIYKIGPTFYLPDDKFIYKPVKVYENDVVYLNMLYLNEARNGFAFRNSGNIFSSLKSYNSMFRETNKNNFDSLEHKLAEE